MSSAEVRCIILGSESRRLGRSSDVGDVGGEELNAVSFAVASGPVVVLGGLEVGVAGGDRGPSPGDRRRRGALVVALWRSQ